MSEKINNPKPLLISDKLNSKINSNKTLHLPNKNTIKSKFLGSPNPHTTKHKQHISIKDATNNSLTPFINTSSLNNLYSLNSSNINSVNNNYSNDNNNINNNNNIDNLDNNNNNNNENNNNNNIEKIDYLNVYNNKFLKEKYQLKKLSSKQILDQINYYNQNSKSNFKCQEFYINNNARNNKKFKMKKTNKISTTKYNIITFIPKSLIIQFIKLSNVYFLFTAIIQSIKIISPLTSFSAILPLIFVLLVSMIRELFEDLQRLKYDNLNNNEIIYVYDEKEKKFIEKKSEKILIGEILLIKENKTVPCDMIILDSNLNEGFCYVETSNLDGEKKLKNKICNNLTYGIFGGKKKLNFLDIIYNDYNKHLNENIKGYCECDLPNTELNKLSGKVELNVSKNNQINFPLTINQMILKGSIIKNTGWVVGFAIYIGSNNKIIMNSKKPRIKLSLIEKKMNKLLIFIFIFLMFLCCLSSILYKIYYNKHKKFYFEFIKFDYSIKTESFLVFFTYFLLLNTLIPISLMITLEFVKFLLGMFMKWDCDLYSFKKKYFCGAKTVSIIEELGNVNFIFSDKTGTLTCNKMQFRFGIIGNKLYEYIDNCIMENNSLFFENYNINDLNTYNFNNIINSIKFGKKFFSNLLSENKQFLNDPTLCNGISESLNNIEKNEEFFIDILTIKEFWLACALTHECVIEKKKDNYFYTGISPDDVELVKTARDQGFTLMNSNVNERKVKIGKNYIKTFELLHVLHFSSERKRMSIILKDIENDKIILYCKGADCEIKNRLNYNMKKSKIKKYIEDKINEFSQKGFRTLMIAYKFIEKEFYQKWHRKLKNSEMNLINKNKLVDLCYDDVENNLTLLGATVVEDKLQDDVPETIKEIRMSGIKMWVLTGDKIDTAENIAKSCNLIDNFNKIFRIKMNDENYKDEIYENKSILKFFNEFNEFILEEKKKEEIIYKNINLNYSNLNIDINKHFFNKNLSNSSCENSSFNMLNNNNNNNNNINFNNYKINNVNIINYENNNNNNNNNKNNNKNNININININNNENNNNNNNNNENDKINNSNGIKKEKNSLKKLNSFKKSLLKNISIYNNKNDEEKIKNYYETGMINFKKKFPIFCIIIESPILSKIFQNRLLTKDFLSIAVLANTVICCRVSPLQKSNVIKEIKNYDKKIITLAIGDGGNDVSMINEANIGIGIFGEEGMSAVKASDFSIGEFKFLRRLLFFHGRNNNNRIGQLIVYFFYKNFVFSISQILFGFFCFMSGQTILDDWLITGFNLVFTSLPLAIQALTDFDVLESDSKECKKLMPYLYRESRDVNRNFNFYKICFNLTKGLIISVFCFYSIIFADYGTTFNKNGDYGTLWFVSIKVYTMILFNVSVNLCLNVRFFVWFFPFVLILTSFFLYLGCLFFFHYNIYFNICGTLIETLKSLRFYFNLLVVVGFNFLVDFAINSYFFFFDFQVSKELMIERKNKHKNNKLIKKFFHNISCVTGIIIKNNEIDENVFDSEISKNNKIFLNRNKTLNMNFKYQSQIVLKKSMTLMNLKNGCNYSLIKNKNLMNSKIINIKGIK